MTQQLTIRKLIALLQQEDPNLPVYLEGCDCYGEAGDIKLVVDPEDYLGIAQRSLIITRTDSA